MEFAGSTRRSSRSRRSRPRSCASSGSSVTSTDMAMRTRLCDLLGIEYPVIQAGMSLFTSAELVAAVSNAGALGSLGCWRRPADDVANQLAKIRELTDRPFAINHLIPALDEPG